MEGPIGSTPIPHLGGSCSRHSGTLPLSLVTLCCEAPASSSRSIPRGILTSPGEPSCLPVLKVVPQSILPFISSCVFSVPPQSVTPETDLHTRDPPFHSITSRLSSDSHPQRSAGIAPVMVIGDGRGAAPRGYVLASPCLASQGQLPTPSFLTCSSLLTLQ